MMIRMLLTVVYLIFEFCIPASAQWQRDVSRQGYPIDPVLEECKTAEDCIRLSDAALEKDLPLGESEKQWQKLYMEKAANMGNAVAQYKLAEMYEEDIDYKIHFDLWGPPREGSPVYSDHYLLDAYVWYKIAELNGHQNAKEKVSFIWDNLEDSWTVSGRIRPKSTHRLAVATHEEALNSVMAEAGIRIGEKYAFSSALPRDYGKAIAYFENGIGYGFTKGYIGMAKLYEQGDAFDRNLVKAYVFASNFSYREDKEYFDNLAQKLSPTELVEAKTQVLIDRYNTFDKSGDDEKYVIKAQMHALGYGELQNYKKARKLFDKYASLANYNAEALFIYATLLEEGLGGKVDLIGAFKWMYILDDDDYEEAKDYIETLKVKLSPTEIKKAIELAYEEIESDY